jgi:hypothetical protein
MTSAFDSVTIRLAGPGDAGALARLAALDSQAVPMAPVLLAEVDGVLVAARSLWDATELADPFLPTAPLLDLLRARERSLAAPARRGRSLRLRRRRHAFVPAR